MMAKKRIKKAKQASARPRGQRKVIVILALVLGLIATTGILAQRQSEKRRKVPTNDASQGATITPAIQVSTSPAKEYVYAGSRLVASESQIIFNDVPQGTQFYADIQKIAARGVTLGCG